MISIKPCPVADVLDSKALIEEYAAECSIPAIGEINPQPAIYAAMEYSGVLHSFMAFDEERRVGFAIVLTPILPHYGKRVATIESLFVARASRGDGAGRELMRTVEEFAKQAGCVGILYSAPTGGQLERLLYASKDYKRTNAVFFRGFA